MSSLFDAIKGALVLIGGMRESDLEKEKVQAETEFKRGTIETARERTAAEKETAAAQRELTAALTREGRYHQTTEREATQAFQSGEFKLNRLHDLEMQKARIDAEVKKYMYEQASATERTILENESREKIAAMQIKLQEKGLTLEWEKLKKMMPWEVEYLLKAATIASQGTTGIEGYATGLTSPEAAQKNVDRFNQTMEQLTKAAGLKNIPKLELAPIRYGAGGVPGRNALPGVESQRPGITPSPTPAPVTKYDNSVLPGVSTLTGRPTETVGIHPKDDFKLNLWATAIKGMPSNVQEEALREYESVLPTELFEGTSGLSPEQNAAYREGLKVRLRSKTAPSFQGR